MSSEKRGINAEQFSYAPSKALFCHSTRASRRIPVLFRLSFTRHSNPATSASSTLLTQPSAAARKVFTEHNADVLSRKLVVKVIALLPRPLSAYCNPEQSEQRERRRRISDSCLLSSATHSESSGLARSLALSFSRVAAARRSPVLPHVLQRNSGFLARARHARGNDRKISTERTCVSLSHAGTQ